MELTHGMDDKPGEWVIYFKSHSFIAVIQDKVGQFLFIVPNQSLWNMLFLQILMDTMADQ